MAAHSELLELASLVKVISQQEEFRNQFLLGENQDLVLHFRNMWFYLTLFVAQSDGSWPKEWVPILTAIAENTPALLPEPTQRSLVADLGSNSILRGAFPEEVFTSDYRLKPKLETVYY